MPEARQLLPLYEQIARRIEQQIEEGIYGPGDRIQSIREICEAYEVADKTAKQALRVLGQKGLIKTVVGAGAYVSDRDGGEPLPAVQQKSVAFLKLGSNPMPIFLYEIDLIQQALIRMGCSMNYMVAPDDEMMNTAIAHIAEAPPACMLIFPSHSRTGPISLPPSLRAIDRPKLVIESISSDCSYVTADTERMTGELTRYLIDLGHRDICLASGFTRKVSGFIDAVQSMSSLGVRHNIIAGLDAPDAAAELSKRILSLKPRPSAIIACNDISASLLVQHLEAEGLRVPDDISVASFDDLPAAQTGQSDLTVIRHPCYEIAEEVRRWVEAQMGGNRPKRSMRRRITGSIIPRETTAQAPRS